MGTDIWVYVERQYHRDGDPPNPFRFQFEHHQFRNYDLFTRLAGVRRRGSSVEPMGEPRGMPVDASPEVQGFYDFLRGQSASWLSLEEAELARNIDPVFDALLDYLNIVNNVPARRGVGWYDTRLVFFFDGE